MVMHRTMNTMMCLCIETLALPSGMRELYQRCHMRNAVTLANYC